MHTFSSKPISIFRSRSFFLILAFHLRFICWHYFTLVLSVFVLNLTKRSKQKLWRREECEDRRQKLKSSTENLNKICRVLTEYAKFAHLFNVQRLQQLWSMRINASKKCEMQINPSFVDVFSALYFIFLFRLFLFHLIKFILCVPFSLSHSLPVTLATANDLVNRYASIKIQIQGTQCRFSSGILAIPLL